MTIIITHPGSAHFDEFLSCCLVMHKFKDIDEIRRKEPAKSDINDPNIWVLDVGGKHDPSLKCYDHHQVDMDDCTLSLLFKEWNLWEKAKEVYKWLEVSVLLDAQGHKEVCRFLNIDSNAIASLDSFIERTILHFFQEEEKINSKHILFSLMREFGKYFFVTIREYHKVLEQVEKKTEFKRIKDVLITLCYKDLKHSNHVAFLMREKRRERYPDEKGGIFIYPNKRVPGTIALKRFMDDERVDFRRLSDCKEVVYVHPKGFFASVKAMSDDELEQYIERAIQ